MTISLAGNKRDKNKYLIYGSSRKVAQNTEASYFEGGIFLRGWSFLLDSLFKYVTQSVSTFYKYF